MKVTLVETVNGFLAFSDSDLARRYAREVGGKVVPNGVDVEVDAGLPRLAEYFHSRASRSRSDVVEYEDVLERIATVRRAVPGGAS